MTPNTADEAFMARALTLAQAQLGKVAPNPAVGCIIVKNGDICGMGATASGGRPHAEVIALKAAGGRAKDADVYVTLEPCAHHGQTGPCADALVAAGVGRVFTACTDPDPRVNGEGNARLKRAGIAVHVGLLQSRALTLNAGFFMRMQRGRPLLCIDRDGRTYDAAFDPQTTNDLAGQLAALGAKGLTRVFMRPDHPARFALQRLNLIDRDLTDK